MNEKPYGLVGKSERVMGIEPTSKAWEALVLPLNYTRENDCFLMTIR